MNTQYRTQTARRPVSFCWLTSFLWLAALFCYSAYYSESLSAAETLAVSRPVYDETSTPTPLKSSSVPTLFLPEDYSTVLPSQPPQVIGDEVLMVSTRNIGLSCQAESMQQGLQYRRRMVSSSGQVVWRTVGSQCLIAPVVNLPTVVYVHGNRVDTKKDTQQGMQVYRSMKASLRNQGPIRFVIWSWPSTKIPGPFRDYLVKAERTNVIAWQLAWFLNRLPEETPISLVGYSYGTRVVTGATHILAGGGLGELRLSERQHAYRPPVRIGLLAAAYNADWIQPGSYYGRALSMASRFVLATNKHDPAMRFYHFSNGRGRIHALGKSGVKRPQTLGSAASRLLYIDFQRDAVHTHALEGYLAASSKMKLFWRKLAPAQANRLGDFPMVGAAAKTRTR